MLVLKWIFRLILGGLLALLMSACTMLGLNYSSLETANKPEAYPALPAKLDVRQTRTTLEAELYGPWPGDLPVTLSARRMIDEAYLQGRGTLEEFDLTIGSGSGARRFTLVLATPNQANKAPVPLIISQTFSGNCSVFPDAAVTSPNGTPCEGSEMTGVTGFLATQIFGTYIAYAPIDRYFDAGLAYASFAGWSYIPDRNGSAQAAMLALGSETAPTSALMAWAHGFHAAAKVLKDDPRLRADQQVAMGHSRYGKAALIASAWSDQIAGAIAHQSGFGGASSSRSTTGETLIRMARSYPHWMRPGLANDLEAGQELTLDQHFLLALSAPKPLFLGNGRRDVWSDPNSSYRLAEAASQAYLEAGSTGLTATNMRDFDPASDIAFWLRTGGHSVVSEDIDAFIAFMSAHFGSGGRDTASSQAEK